MLHPDIREVSIKVSFRNHTETIVAADEIVLDEVGDILYPS